MGIEQRVECVSGKLLARVTPDGIKLWCERHKREHLLTWEALDALRREVGEHVVTNQSVIIPH